MKLRIATTQKGGIEREMILQEAPLVARRLRADFPRTLADTGDGDLAIFARACAEQALALGALEDVEQVYHLAAVNTNLARIEADPLARAYFDRIAGDDALPGGRRIALLYRNLSAYFEMPVEPPQETP